MWRRIAYQINWRDQHDLNISCREKIEKETKQRKTTGVVAQ